MLGSQLLSGYCLAAGRSSNNNIEDSNLHKLSEPEGEKSQFASPTSTRKPLPRARET